MEELLNNLRMQNTFVFMTYIKHRSHNVLQEKKKKKQLTELEGKNICNRLHAGLPKY